MKYLKLLCYSNPKPFSKHFSSGSQTKDTQVFAFNESFQATTALWIPKFHTYLEIGITHVQITAAVAIPANSNRSVSDVQNISYMYLSWGEVNISGNQRSQRDKLLTPKIAPRPYDKVTPCCRNWPLLHKWSRMNSCTAITMQLVRVMCNVYSSVVCPKISFYFDNCFKICHYNTWQQNE